MNFQKLKTSRISSAANSQIIKDYFPKNYQDFFEKQILLEPKESSLHAGALCLYACTLMTKIYQDSPEKIKLKSNVREIDLQNYMKTCDKYSNLTDQQIKIKAHEMVLRDIRNCFAHGNFKISYDVNTRDLYFILSPQRKDITINTPIIISATSLTDANKEFVAKIGFGLLGLNPKEMQDNVQNNLNQLLKSILLPTQLLKMVDDYFDYSRKIKSKTPIDEKKSLLLQYILQTTQIIYEQDDYYNIFGKDSNIFERISLIRNSIAHDSFTFTDLSRNIHYTDRDRSLDEKLSKSVSSLFAANELKELIVRISKKGHSTESIQDLTDKLKECFDMLFGQDNELPEFCSNDL